MIEDDAGKLYYVYCNTSFEPPKVFLGMNDDKIEVLSISDTEFRVKNTAIAAKCYDDQTGKLVVDNPSYNLNLMATPFTISYTKNMYAGVGCNIWAGFYGTSRGCVSKCANKEDIVEGPCSGSGCCQANIQKGLNNISEEIQNVTSEFPVQSFSQCNFAFLVETGQYTFQSSDLQLDGRLTKPDMDLPVVLDWAIGGRSCREAQSISSDIASDRYACKNNTVCSNAPDNPGYRCACEKGYEGNPYLGCQDINECEDENNNPCYGTCTNTIGGYNCSACPEGTNGDGRKDGTSCTTISKDGFPVLWVALGLSLGFLFIIVCGLFLFLCIRKRKLLQLKEKFFQQNGGLLLRQQLPTRDGGVDSTKIFTEAELKLATNNYHSSQVLGEGGFGTVYKGTLSDNRVVAIKKSNKIDKSQIEQFINEVLILTQINHRNVVKLLGCCLETEVPLLVYEFVSNGTLSQHIHQKGAFEKNSMSWENRLRIATEIASAIAYLHSAASIPIIHRDIKSANILLDDNYVAKVADFGASRLVPLDQTRVNTAVQGTFGYVDPEYFHSGELTDKSDVYSFGVMLVELLTGEKTLCMERSEEQRSLTTYFLSLAVKNEEFKIIAAPVNEGHLQQVRVVIEIAKKCLRWKGGERPPMKQIAADLQSLAKFNSAGWDSQPLYPEETTNFPSETKNFYSNIPSNLFDHSSMYTSETNVDLSIMSPR
ncbi:wall-associated receptor kinase 5-like [Papaver somniferum]|uniref:wall-associated receptor kinase 5-like n=1 Tax=Papaver somniferum TaxID=3469 RepID=UPI000E6FC669|nr:wall-associated receptor kinase 5-like [Papaver somniferum]